MAVMNYFNKLSIIYLSSLSLQNLFFILFCSVAPISAHAAFDKVILSSVFFLLV